MKTLYTTLLLIILIFFSLPGFAQTTGALTGVVKDEKGEAMSYGSIAIIRTADGAVITGAAVDLDGKFNIKTPAAGKYILRVNAMGYANAETPAFEVSSTFFSKDFGTLVLKQDTKELKEVKIEALRPTIVNQADKMVVSVENSVTAAGATAYEVLTKSPGVWVDQDGNIQLNGKAGVKVMIDGKLTYLSGKELQSLLQSMPAENLKDLELITNPSAKYDAEGSGGIININLKKNTISGLNGSAYVGYSYNEAHGYNSGANLNYKKGKLSTFGNIDMSRRVNMRDMRMDRTFNSNESSSSLNQKGFQNNTNHSPSLRLGADYELTNQHSIGASANLRRNNGDSYFHTETYLRSSQAPNNMFIDALNRYNTKFFSGSFNAHYLGKLDTLGTTLSGDVDYVRITDRNNGYFENEYYTLDRSRLDSVQLLSSFNPPHYDIYSAKIDFTKPLNKKAKFEIGAKVSHVISDNSLNFYEQLDNTFVLDPKRTNYFIYKENIYAGYVNFSTPLGSKWNLQAGLRAEQTDSKGNSVTTNMITSRHYLDFFPSVFLQQKVSDNYQISYNYSRRINRPYYENLNPFIFYLDPYTWAQGNPQLRPQYTNSFEITQTLKNSYNLVLNYANTKDMIGEVPEQNLESLTTVFQQRNISRNESMNATLIVPVKITPKWEISNNITLAYLKNKTFLKEVSYINNQTFMNAQVNNNILLPKNFKLEVNGSYRGKVAYGLYRIEETWGVDAGVKRSFMEDKLDVSLNVTDIFRTRQQNGSANIDGNTNSFRQYHYSQGVRINFRYRFNKGEKFEMKSRNTNLDELNRAGGN